MKRVSLLLITITILVAGVSAQKNDLLIHAGEFTTASVCGRGAEDLAKRSTISGIVKSRIFAEDELSLTGITLADNKDRRTFVNIDEDRAFNYASARTDLDNYFMVGKKVSMEIIECGRIKYLAKVLK